MILAECRGEEVTVEGLGPRDSILVVRWPNGILTREPEAEVINERVVEVEGDERDEG